MARVTVEDCILSIPNRFDLVIVAAQRAKQISAGNPLTIDRDNDKDAVVALREVADKTVDLGQLHEDVVQLYCRRYPADRMEQDDAKATESLEELTEQVEDAFEAVRQQMAMGRTGRDSGMSFEGEDVKAED